MAVFTALLDSNILYAAPKRDLFLELGVLGIFRVRWTNHIHDEWNSSLLKDRPDLTADQLSRTRKLMNAAIPDSLVTNYERLIPSLTLPDPDDRHVLAAAIVARADVIVTCNSRDFPVTALEPYGIEAQHPDEFLAYQFDLAPGSFCHAVKRIRGRLKRPPVNVADYLHNLEQAQHLPEFVKRLRGFQSEL